MSFTERLSVFWFFRVLDFLGFQDKWPQLQFFVNYVIQHNVLQDVIFSRASMNWIFSCQSEGRQNNNGKDCGFKITKVDDIMAGNTNLIFRLENKHRSVWKYWLRSIIIFGLFLAILIFLSHLTLIFVVKVFQKFFFSSFLNFFKNFFSVELTFPIAPFII